MTLQELNNTHEVTFQGKKFYATGKKGTDFKTGQPAIELADAQDYDRVWLDIDGTIKLD